MGIHQSNQIIQIHSLIKILMFPKHEKENEIRNLLKKILIIKQSKMDCMFGEKESEVFPFCTQLLKIYRFLRYHVVITMRLLQLLWEYMAGETMAQGN